MKLFSIAALSATLFCSSAFADTMYVTFGAPVGDTIKMTIQVGNGPVQEATVVSSKAAIGPKGCNYRWIIVGDKTQDGPVAIQGQNNSGCGKR